MYCAPPNHPPSPPPTTPRSRARFRRAIFEVKIYNAKSIASLSMRRRSPHPPHPATSSLGRRTAEKKTNRRPSQGARRMRARARAGCSGAFGAPAAIAKSAPATRALAQEKPISVRSGGGGVGVVTQRMMMIIWTWGRGGCWTATAGKGRRNWVGGWRARQTENAHNRYACARQSASVFVRGVVRSCVCVCAAPAFPCKWSSPPPAPSLPAQMARVSRGA